MPEQFQESPLGTETIKSEQEKLQEEAKKTRDVLRMVYLAKERRIGTQNRLREVQKEISELRGEKSDEVTEVKYDPSVVKKFEALSDEEILKKAPAIKEALEGEIKLRVFAKDNLTVAESELEKLKKEKSDNLVITQKIEIAPVTPVAPEGENVNESVEQRLNEANETNRKLVNDIAEIRSRFETTQKELIVAENALVETKSKLALSENRAKQLDEQVTALLEILKKNGIVIQATN